MTIDGWDKRVIAGEPAALRRLLEGIAEKHKITIHWTARPSEWRAGRNRVHIPPAIDKVAAAIGLHELSHCIAGPCPRTGDHRGATVEGTTLICLACEQKSWEIAVRLVPFDRSMHDRMRAALGTYRRGALAPVSVQRETDRFMSSLAFAERAQAAMRMQDRIARQQRANESLARDAAKEAEIRRKFAALLARQEAARRSL